MPTPVEITIISIFVAICIPALTGYGKMRDEMATLRERVGQNQQLIAAESRRNDTQDAHLQAMLQTLTRVDTNVARLLDEVKGASPFSVNHGKGSNG